MYCTTNFSTKKALREAIARGEEHGVYQPGPFNRGVEQSGRFAVEGPHYPRPHSWYATVTVVDGRIVKVQ
jgi:hypothetical protein